MSQYARTLDKNSPEREKLEESIKALTKYITDDAIE